MQLSLGTNVMSIRDYLSLVKSGKIQRYSRNRGDGKVCKATQDRVASAPHMYSVGEIKVGQLPTGVLEIADGHSRTAGLLLALSKGLLSDTFLDYKIPVSVVPHFAKFEVYADSNSGKQHTARQKLVNTDYWFSNMIESIVNKSGWAGSFNDKLRNQLAYITYAYISGLDMEFSNVYSYRNPARELLDRATPDLTINISYSQQIELAEAVKYYREVMEDFSKLFPNKTMTEEGRYISKSSGLFGIIVCDYLSSHRRLTKRNSSILARKIFNKLANIKTFAHTATHGKKIDMQANIGRLYVALKV